MTEDVKVYTHYDRPPKEFEEVSDELLVERAGYVPAKVQIENMIYAGIRLRDFREDEFDGETDEEAEANYDPSRDPNFDWTDAGNILRDIEGKVAAGDADGRVESGAESSASSESVQVTGSEA